MSMCVSFPISTASIGMNFNYGISYTAAAAQLAETTMPKKCTKYPMDSDDEKKTNCIFTVAKTKLE